MPGLFSWHLRISLEHLQQHSPSLLLAQADPSWDNDRTPSQKSLSATYNPLITTAQGEWCQGSGMCDAVLWRCTVCVCVCVWREERRGGAMPNSEKVKVRERRCSPTTEKCEKQGGKMWSEPEEEGRRWLGVVNDFARRSQTALARLGEVGNNASLCQALTNQPSALKMKKRKRKIVCIDCSALIGSRMHAKPDTHRKPAKWDMDTAARRLMMHERFYTKGTR